jgi:cell division protein FtsW (lipid II flippase)
VPEPARGASGERVGVGQPRGERVGVAVTTMNGVSTAPPVPRYRQPTRRWTEAGLLVTAFVVGAAAYVQVDLAVLGRIADDTVPVLAAVASLLLVVHLFIRHLARWADPIVVPTVAALNILGLTMIHRLDLAESLRAERNHSLAPSPDVYTQLTWTALGVVLFIAVLVVVRDHRTLQRYTYTAMLAGLVLLLLPLAPVIGATVNGATLWVRLAGLSFQPGEIAKVLLTIFFAGYLTVTRDSLALVRTKVLGMEFPRGRDTGPLFVAWFVSLAVLVFERDLGTSLLFFGLFVSLLYIATQRRSWLVLGAVLFITGAVLAYLAFGHVRLRVDVWLHPFADEADTGYQIAQSLYGFASGGMFGSGLGQGYPQLVPYAKSDFIIAAFGEELGLIGLLAMLTLYALVVERGLRTAIACRDVFGTLLAAGLSISLALQLFVVVGGVSRLIPLTGLTTPFLAQGGSSLVANWISIGLLMRISDTARRPDLDAVEPEDALTQVVPR